MKGKRVVLTKAEKKMWPILEITVRQVRRDGSKIAGSSKWVSYCQREIRKMLPKRVRCHFGLKAAGAVLFCVALSGCAMIHKTTEKVRDLGTAVFKTTEIIDAAADDVESVWKEAPSAAPAPPK